MKLLHIHQTQRGAKEVKAGSISLCGHKAKATKGVNYEGAVCGACVRRVLKELDELRWEARNLINAA